MMRKNMGFKLGSRFLFVFIIAIILIGCFQVLASIYSSDISFDNSVKGQLTSIVQVKGERISDYFDESMQDVSSFSEDSKVREVFLLPLEKSSSAVLDVEKRLSVLASQLRLFVDRNSNWVSSDFLSDNQFRSLALQSVGKSGSTYIFSSKDNKILLGQKKSGAKRFEESLLKPTSDNVVFSLGANIYEEDFVSVEELSTEYENYFERYLESFGYSNIYFVSNSGQIIYGSEMIGQNILYEENEDSPFRAVYDKALNRRTSVSYGPYKDVGVENLKLLFASPVYSGTSVIGVLILEDSVEEINDIVLSGESLGEDYVIDRDSFLITPLESRGYSPMVQKVESKGASDCFSGKTSVVEEFVNYGGENVYGTYSYVSDVDWCIISETSKMLLTEIPRKKSLKENVLFTVGFVLFFLLLSLYVKNRFDMYNVKLVPKTKDFVGLKNAYLYLMIVVAIVFYFAIEGYIFVFSSFLLLMFLSFLAIFFVRVSRVNKDYLRVMISWGLLIVFFTNLFKFMGYQLDSMLFGYMRIVLLLFEMIGFLIIFMGIKNFGGKK